MSKVKILPRQIHPGEVASGVHCRTPIADWKMHAVDNSSNANTAISVASEGDNSRVGGGGGGAEGDAPGRVREGGTPPAQLGGMGELYCIQKNDALNKI